VAQPPKNLSQVRYKGYDLYLSCRACKRQVTVPVERVMTIFEASG
jgi:hypothetical protein